MDFFVVPTVTFRLLDDEVDGFHLRSGLLDWHATVCCDNIEVDL